MIHPRHASPPDRPPASTRSSLTQATPYRRQPRLQSVTTITTTTNRALTARHTVTRHAAPSACTEWMRWMTSAGKRVRGLPSLTPHARFAASAVLVRSPDEPTLQLGEHGEHPRPNTASLLPGLLAATRTRLTPAGDDELTTKDQLNSDLRSAGRANDQG
jgi:hypothetical protein